MTCNCDCYWGCDTQANRRKYLACGVLFAAWLVIRLTTMAVIFPCVEIMPDGTLSSFSRKQLRYWVSTVLIHSAVNRNALRGWYKSHEGWQRYYNANSFHVPLSTLRGHQLTMVQMIITVPYPHTLPAIVTSSTED
jgi:hypothetical protein